VNSQLSIDEVIAQIEDGMTVGIGGWGARRKPMALVRALCASPVRDLTVVSYGGPDVGLLCAAGKVKKLVYGFVSLDVIALDSHFRKARESASIEAMEIDEGMLQWGLYAASLRLPFLPTRAGLATDVQAINPEIATIRSPYADGEMLVAMPALELDVALVHANRADMRGNVQVLGPDPYFDDLYAGAARRCFVSCERIVPTEELLDAGCVHTLLLNRAVVTGVVETPFGAHPTSCAPDYELDVEHLRTYAGAVDEDSWAAYRALYVDPPHEAYVDAVGGASRIEALETVAL
jgi:glutaconate CoA-transferase, subunit A